MPFPFPQNPVDGQVVSHPASDGFVLKATYNAAKNEWVIEREHPAGQLVLSPSEFHVIATADRQVIVWDATTRQWIAAAQEVPRLTSLTDTDTHSSPTLGSMPIWSYVPGHPEAGKFLWKTPPAHIKNWDSIMHWESGSAVYHHGQLWRATRDSNNVEPMAEDGRAQLYIHVAGEPTFGILPTGITSTDPPVGPQPMTFKLGYWLQYTNDHHMTVWKWVLRGMDPSTHHPYGEWEARPWTCMAWRNPNPPSNPTPPGTVVVWIRTEPGSVTQPIKGQQDWASLELSNYLSQCGDVSVTALADGDLLTYSAAAHKWVPITRAQLAASLGVHPTTP